MTSPKLLAAAASTRTEAEVRAARKARLAKAKPNKKSASTTSDKHA